MLTTKNYMFSQYGKKIKSTSELTKYLNAYTSLLLCIYPNRNSLILTKDNDISDYFIYYKEKKYS